MNKELNLTKIHIDKKLPIVLEYLQKVEVSYQKAINQKILSEQFEDILKIDPKPFYKKISKL